MKKSVFALLALATMVLTMASCSKDDAGSNAVNTSMSKTTKDPVGNYEILFQLVGNKASSDSTAQVVKTAVSISVTIATESVARDKFNTRYALWLSRLQERVNNALTVENLKDAHIICTLKNAKGDILLQKDVTPNK